MTDSSIKQLDWLDNEYVKFLTKQQTFESEPSDADVASEIDIKLQFVKKLRTKPETPEEWESLKTVWEEACGFPPRAEHFELISMFLWEPDSTE